MAEANGNRTHPGPYRPLAGFEDQGHHQAPVTSVQLYSGSMNYHNIGSVKCNVYQLCQVIFYMVFNVGEGI